MSLIKRKILSPHSNAVLSVNDLYSIMRFEQEHDDRPSVVLYDGTLLNQLTRLTHCLFSVVPLNKSFHAVAPT